MRPVTHSDIYARIHKGLRKALFELAYNAGRTDYANPEEWAGLKAQAEFAFYFLTRHGEIEDTFQLPVLEASLPGSTQADMDEHVVIHGQLHDIEMEIARIDGLTSDAERRQAGEQLYLQINAFIAAYLPHMHREESKMAPLFLEHCDQQDLQKMLGSIIANTPPADVMKMLSLTIPANDPVERALFLGEIKQNAPPPAFEAMMGVVRNTLSESEWTRLQADLN